MGRVDIRDIAEFFDLEKIESDLTTPPIEPIEPETVPNYVLCAVINDYKIREYQLEVYSGMGSGELIDKFANGWKLVPPEEGAQDDR